MKKVIIVDDARQGLVDLRDILARPFTTLFEATSGRQAIDIHRREKTDLIVLDFAMPGMDGEAVARAIRADAAMRHVSIMMFSEDARHAVRRRALNAGANE